jgi:competence protein ComEA
MEAPLTPVGVAAASPAPPPSWPAESRWIEPPSEPSVRLPSDPAPAWSRSAQGTAVLLLGLALALLAWHAWQTQNGRCRPSTLETPDLISPALDLNQADRAQLLQLPGVGDNLARRIEAYRTEHRGFRDVDELRNVAGIGPKMLEKLRPLLYVEQRNSDDADEPAKEIQEKNTPLVHKKKEALKERIDVTRASSAELQQLPGIGPKLSQRIVETRQKKAFRSVDDLRRVPGIGPKILERLRPHVVVP